MKRFFSLLFTLLGLVGIVYILTVRTQGPDLLTLIPCKSPAVAIWDNPDQAYHDFLRTKLGKSMQNINWQKVFATIGMRDETVAHAASCASLWQAFSKSTIFQKVIGKKIVLALVNNTSPGSARIKGGAKMILLCKVDRRQTVKDFRSFLCRSNILKPLPVISYQGHTIYAFQAKEIGHLYIASHKDVMIVAFDPAPIRQSLDFLLAGLVGKRTSTIINNQQFAQLYHRAKNKDDFFCYLDPEIISRILGTCSTIKGNNDGFPCRFLLHLADRGLRQVAFYHRQSKEVHTFSWVFRFDDQALSPYLKLLTDRPPVVDKTIERTTADLQLYLWSNWLDLPAWWRLTMDHGSAGDRIRARRLDYAVQHYTGMDMDKFLDLFGHRFSLLIKEFKTSVFFPVPRVCFWVALTDKNAVNNLLNMFAVTLPHHRDKVANLDVVSILAGGGLMQPSYTLMDNDLLVVDGRDMIDDILKPSALLLQDSDFRKVEIGSGQPANLIFFTRMKQVIRSLQELASKLGTLISIQDSKKGVKSKILIDQLAMPLLDGLSMFKTAFINGHTVQDEFILETKFFVGDKGKEKK